MAERTEQDHVEMMRHPDRWPHSFILPLEHRTRKEPGWGNMGLLGFMLEDTDRAQAAPRVYIGVIYFDVLGLKLADLPFEDYPDVAAAVRAGWEVN